MSGTVLYDLDHTLIDCDSDHEWGAFLADAGAVDAADYRARNQAFYDDYRSGALDARAYLDFVLEPLAALAPERLAALRARFLATRIRGALRPKAQRLLAADRAAGRRQLIVTSTCAFIAAPIAELLGVPTLIAPTPEERDGRCTGRLADGPCFGADKPRRVREWAQRAGVTLGETWGYSDSFNDLPLLEFVDHPTAVDPDPTLRSHAERRGWPILSLGA